MSVRSASLNTLRHIARAAQRPQLSTASARPSTMARFTPLAVGVTAAAGYAFYSMFSNTAYAESKATLTGGDEWVDLKVKESIDLSHNTRRIVFDLPEGHTLGLHTASCVLTKFVNPKSGKNVIRPYTPTSDPELEGKVEFVIKKYEGGLMSTHIHSLKPGDTLAFKGPILKYKWEANKHKQIALLGGGTGITPLYQLIQEIHKNPADKTKVTLLYGSLTEKDILLKDELDAFAKDRPDQFKFVYFVDKASPNWKGETGYISKEYLEKNLFKPSDDNVHIFVCGPPPFYNALSGNKVSPTDQGELTGALKDLGFTKEQVFKF